MAAHCCTIFHNLLKELDDARFLVSAKSALSYASGIDDSLGFNFEWEHDFHALYDAIDPLGDKKPDIAKARVLMKEMFDIMNPVLQHYGCSDEFQRVKLEYWKPCSPWALKRHRLFHTATGFDHAAAGTGAPYTDKGQQRYADIAAGVR
jgi:hypothetical protein